MVLWQVILTLIHMLTVYGSNINSVGDCSASQNWEVRKHSSSQKSMDGHLIPLRKARDFSAPWVDWSCQPVLPAASSSRLQLWMTSTSSSINSIPKTGNGNLHWAKNPVQNYHSGVSTTLINGQEWTPTKTLVSVRVAANIHNICWILLACIMNNYSPLISTLSGWFALVAPVIKTRHPSSSKSPAAIVCAGTPLVVMASAALGGSIGHHTVCAVDDLHNRTGWRISGLWVDTVSTLGKEFSQRNHDVPGQPQPFLSIASLGIFGKVIEKKTCQWVCQSLAISDALYCTITCLYHCTATGWTIVL